MQLPGSRSEFLVGLGLNGTGQALDHPATYSHRRNKGGPASSGPGAVDSGHSIWLQGPNPSGPNILIFMVTQRKPREGGRIPRRNTASPWQSWEESAGFLLTPAPAVSKAQNVVPKGDELCGLRRCLHTRGRDQPGLRQIGRAHV